MNVPPKTVGSREAMNREASNRGRAESTGMRMPVHHTHTHIHKPEILVLASMAILPAQALPTSTIGSLLGSTVLGTQQFTREQLIS